MMGLTDGTYYLSWFIVYTLISSFIALVIALMAGLGIFVNVNLFLLFVFTLLYALSYFGWAFILVSFLPTPRSAGLAAVLWAIISNDLAYLLKDPSTSSSLQYGLSVLPNVCMNQVIKQIFFYNFFTREGLSFSAGSTVYQGYSFRNGMLILFLDTVGFGLLGLYLDQVIPTQFGVAKPWNFLCKCKKKAHIGVGEGYERLMDDDDVGPGKNRANFEPVGDTLKKQEKTNECLKVRGLVKRFGEKKAVNGTSMTMYKGQIFALLGHNGAGKTTTLSMLTGLLQPTEGRAEVFGIDIFNNMSEVRKMLGVCPQHDVLFDYLTPQDHLRLFAAFKGTDSAVIEGQVQQMLIDIDLQSVKDQICKTLSGGQKRKLSVAIAMIGSSKLVLLDEPSSGMDTSSRRKLWEMLKKNKAGKIVILTTHYMDEADILGDRICIMAEGDIVCTGSSLFLKNRYGVGYNLVIAKKDRRPAPEVEKFVQERIPSAKKMQEVSSEIAYQLPAESSMLFKQFF